MLSLIAASILFFAIHFVIAGTALRQSIVARIGERPYMGLFGLLSLGALVWMSWAYAAADYEELWLGAAWQRGLASLLTLPAVVLAVLAFASPNPTSVGMQAALKRDDAAKGVFRITRHPLMWGIALWSLAHILVNGHLAALIFFATLGLLAVFGSRRIDARKAAVGGDDWARFAAATSWLPFQAIVEGRSKFSFGEIGWLRLAIGIAVYAVIWLFHGSKIANIGL